MQVNRSVALGGTAGNCSRREITNREQNAGTACQGHMQWHMATCDIRQSPSLELWFHYGNLTFPSAWLTNWMLHA